MDNVNQKIIDAVIKKAEQVCPDSLALIGIYGSVATGDTYEKSDLDLLILIKNDEGWKLSTTFILEDRQVGYDIYCTTWESLVHDAECRHAQLSKLMDSGIVYIRDPEAYRKLCDLRAQTKQFLESEKRFQRAFELLDKAKVFYADACLHETLGQVRMDVFGVLHGLMDALMLFHGRYFRRGTKRMLEELSDLPLEADFAENVKRMVSASDIPQLRALAKELLLYTRNHMHLEKDKQLPSEDNLRGIYEEMYSNWRNKVEEAAKQEDGFASFMNMCSLQYMADEISSEVATGTFDIMEAYDPNCLGENVRIFDGVLEKYREEYRSAGMAVRRFPDADAFAADYLKE